MKSSKPNSRNYAVSLRQMLRRERRSRWLVIVLAQAFVLPWMLMIIVGAAYGSTDAACGTACALVYLLPVLAIPFAIFLNRYDSAKTWELLRFSLSPLGDVEKLIDSIDGELADGAHIEVCGISPSRFRRQTNGTVVLTRSWILWFGLKEFRFLPVSHVLWFYKLIEAPSAWWDIRDRRRSQLACVTRRNELLELRALDEEFLDDALEILIRKRPEALFGFRAEWMELAEKAISPVLEEVARRRAKWQLASPEERAEWRNDCLADARHFVCRVDSEAVKQEW
jgi:hypothetical protein